MLDSTKQYAIIAGVSEYGAGISTLPAVQNDVREMEKILASAESVFSDERLVVLVDESATRATVCNALRTAFKDAGQEDTIFAYLAGHGTVENSDYYFLPHDSDLHDIENSCISLDEIKSLFDETDSQKVLLWLDFCHSGGILARRSVEDEDLVISRRLEVVRGKGKVIVAACTPSQYSYESAAIGHGLFTDALIRGLRGEAKSTHGEVTASSLYDFVDRHVTHENQQPVFFGEMTGRIVLMHFPKVTPTKVDSPIGCSQFGMRDLIRTISASENHRSLVPFVGSGISAQYGYPLWQDFILACARQARCLVDVRRILKQNTNSISELAVDRIEEKSPGTIASMLQRHFQSDVDVAQHPDTAIHALPLLRPAIVFTSCVDTLLETAFASANYAFDKVVDGKSSPLDQAEGARVLVKLHGTHCSNASNVVLGSKALATPAYSLLERHIEESTILFIGCRLDRDSFLVPMADKPGSSRHFAIVSDEGDCDKKAKYLLNQHIQPIWYPANNNQSIGTLLRHLANAMGRDRSDETLKQLALEVVAVYGSNVLSAISEALTIDDELSTSSFRWLTTADPDRHLVVDSLEIGVRLAAYPFLIRKTDQESINEAVVEYGAAPALVYFPRGRTYEPGFELDAPARGTVRIREVVTGQEIQLQFNEDEYRE